MRQTDSTGQLATTFLDPLLAVDPPKRLATKWPHSQRAAGAKAIFVSVLAKHKAMTVWAGAIHAGPDTARGDI